MGLDTCTVQCLKIGAGTLDEMNVRTGVCWQGCGFVLADITPGGLGPESSKGFRLTGFRVEQPAASVDGTATSQITLDNVLD